MSSVREKEAAARNRKLATENQELRAAVASLSKDRDRLNWLEAKGEEFTAYGKVRRMEWAIEGTTDLSLRSAIDQAMQVSGGSEKETEK